jgi:hypothetical protein
MMKRSTFVAASAATVASTVSSPYAVAATPTINFTMTSFALNNTRAVHEDTDYIALVVSQNGVVVPPQTQRVGNVNNGTHKVGPNGVGLTVSIPNTYKTSDHLYSVISL